MVPARHETSRSSRNPLNTPQQQWISLLHPRSQLAALLSTAVLIATVPAQSIPMAPKSESRAIPKTRPLGLQQQPSNPKWYKPHLSTSSTSTLARLGCGFELTQRFTNVIKLSHSMLEDSSIQHLISWSSTNDSFVMSPTSEFSKVLASVF